MKIIIVGSGPAAHSAAEAIRRETREDDVVMITKEKEPEYSPCVLPYYVAGEVKREHNFIKSLRDYEKLKIRVLFEKEVQKVFPQQKRILVDGKEESYDRLILALGTDPVIPPLPGTKLPRNFTLKTIEDADKLAAAKIKRAVVVGSGAVGIETALALSTKGVGVTIIEKLPGVMPKMLNGGVGTAAEKALKEAGINVQCGVEVSEVLGDERVEAVKVGQAVIECDAVVWGVGMKPATGFLQGSGIELNHAGLIKTNEFMQTNIHDIFACGDCACAFDLIDQKHKNIMLWHVAKLGGKAAGLNALGLQTIIPPFRAQVVVNIGQLTFAAIGEIPQEETEASEFVYGSRIYRILFKDEKIMQCQSLNDPAGLGTLQPLLGRKRDQLKNIELFKKMPWSIGGKL